MKDNLDNKVTTSNATLGVPTLTDLSRSDNKGSRKNKFAELARRFVPVMAHYYNVIMIPLPLPLVTTNRITDTDTQTKT